MNKKIVVNFKNLHIPLTLSLLIVCWEFVAVQNLFLTSSHAQCCRTSGKKSQFFTPPQYLYLFKLKKYFLCINNRVAKQLAKNKKKGRADFDLENIFMFDFYNRWSCDALVFTMFFILLFSLILLSSFDCSFVKKSNLTGGGIVWSLNTTSALLLLWSPQCWYEILIRTFSSLSRKHQPTVTSEKNARIADDSGDEDEMCGEISSGEWDVCAD